MYASQPLRLLIALFVITSCTAINQTAEGPTQNDTKMKNLDLFDGVSVKIPESNTTDQVMSVEIDTNKGVETGRGKDKKNLMQRILPLFIMPFVIQSAIVPMFLSMLKFMLFKSMMVGKIALALILFNAFKNNNSFKGRDAEIANVHYGYHGNGMEEYGAYVN